MTAPVVDLTLGRIVDGLDARTYHADPAWGSSSLKAMRQGPPARVLWQRDHPVDTDARLLGTAVHAAFLQPELYAASFVAKPDGMTFATKEGKAWRDAQFGKTILAADLARDVSAIVKSLEAKRIVSDALSAAELVRYETSLFWRDLFTGEPCKGRPDIIAGGYLYDLKVSRHAGPNLSWRAFTEGWMHQLAHYREGASRLGLGTLGGRLIVVSSAAPFYVWTLEVKPDALDLLAIENSQTIAALSDCRESNRWPDSPDEWTPIEPPPSALIGGSVLDALTIEEE